jgi:hypothetical protein
MDNCLKLYEKEPNLGAGEKGSPSVFLICAGTKKCGSSQMPGVPGKR